MTITTNGSRPQWLNRLRAQLPRPVTRVREIIGRWVYGDAQINLFRSRSRVKTVDQTIPDYEFWDKLRRGKQSGYRLGGLFAPRIEQVLATWVLGSGVTVKLRATAVEGASQTSIDHTNTRLAEFMASLLDAGHDDDQDDPDRDDRQSSMLLNVYRNAMGLGDQYVIVNGDGSLSVPSPDTVHVERDPLDYRRVVSVTVTTKLDEYTLEDIYRADGRTLNVKRGGRITENMEFENLLGRIPVVHVAHGMGGNETYGHSIHDDLLELYDQYDDVIFKQLDGAKLLGNPILTLQGLEDLGQVVDANKPAQTDTYFDRDGNEVNHPELNIDQNSILLLGKGGSAQFTAPPVGFTEDTKTALKSLFLLLLDRTGIPEFIWGNEMSSARASSETQLTQFEMDIDGRRADAGGWIARLCRIWLQVQAVTDPQILDAPLEMTWPELLDENKEIVLQKIQTALAEGLITMETALELLELVDDAPAEVEAALKEAEQRRASTPAPDGSNENDAPMDERMNTNEMTAILDAATRIVARGS